MHEGAESADILVSAVVVTHNNASLIERCLDATRAAASRYPHELIVVDNDSSDGTVDAVARGASGARLLTLSRNAGFAQAVNRARDIARGRYIALVNSDAFPDVQCLDRLVETLEQKPEVGIVGARLRYGDDRPQPSAGTFPSLHGGLWVALLLHRLPLVSRLGLGVMANQRLYRRARRVDWVSAAVCAARMEVGPMPAGLFMYGEDVEWCVQCNRAGYEVWLQPAATAVHLGRATVNEQQRGGFAQRQRAEFELTWFARRGVAARLGARVVLALHAVIRLLLYALPGLVGRGPVGRMAEYRTLFRAAFTVQPRSSGDHGPRS